MNDLERRDDSIICKHCSLPITKFTRPPWYTAPAKRPAKAPPPSYLDQLRVPFAPIVGPDEAIMVSIQTELSGPLHGQPEGWELDAMFPLSRQASSEHLSVIRPETQKAVFKPPPPEVPIVPKPHPPIMNKASSSSSKVIFKTPPPLPSAPDAYSRGTYKSPVSA